MLKWLVFGLVAACFWVSVMTKGSGPPTSACVTMEPSHTGITKQTSTSPYTLNVDKTEVKAGDTGGITVTVNVGTNADAQFQGLFVQARKAGSTTPVGTFQNTTADLKTIQCSNADDAIGHNSKDDKGVKSFKWIPHSPEKTEKIKFRATVAQTKEKYWVGVESMEVTVTGTGGTIAITTAVSMFFLPVLTIFVNLQF